MEFWSGLCGGENSSSELDISGLAPSRGDSWLGLLVEALLFSVFSLRGEKQTPERGEASVMGRQSKKEGRCIGGGKGGRGKELKPSPG